VPSVQTNITHPALTARRNLAYVFTPKHHGASQTSSCWLPALTLDEEFAIFDRADGVVVQPPILDNRQVADANGNLYGYEMLPNGSLREIGTWHQQLAEFPVQAAGANWHGYPIWPIGPQAPQNLQGQKCRPDSQIFDRMVQLGNITPGQRKRLKKGDWI
jgi:hypothetical protein